MFKTNILNLKIRKIACAEKGTSYKTMQRPRAKHPRGLITIIMIFISLATTAEDTLIICDKDKTKMPYCPTPYELLLNKIHRKIVNTTSIYQESTLRSEIMDTLSSRYPEIFESMNKLGLELNEGNAVYYALLAQGLTLKRDQIELKLSLPISATEVASIENDGLTYNLYDPSYSAPFIFDIDNDGALELISIKSLGTMRIDELIIWSQDGSTYKPQDVDESKITHNLQKYDWGNQGVMQYIAKDFYYFKKNNIASNYIYQTNNIYPYCDSEWIKMILENNKSFEEYSYGCQDKKKNKLVFEQILNHLSDTNKKEECLNFYNQINKRFEGINDPCKT